MFCLQQILTKHHCTLKTLHSWESNAHRYTTFKAANGFHEASSSDAHLVLHGPPQHEHSLLIADCSEHSENSFHKNVADYSYPPAEKTGAVFPSKDKLSHYAALLREKLNFCNITVPFQM